MWREEAKLDSVISSAQKELDHAERMLSHTMDQNTSRGIAAVRRIKRQLNLDGIYGTLAELIEVSERYRTAVEVTAGNSLFHYVVDTDETATKALEVLQREKLGRVTFMPLNRLRPRPGNIPRSNDAISMIEKINYDQRYEKALQQVFGKTIICPNLAIAAQYARSHGVNAITPEGDRSDKKGALTGGFYDPRHSRLEAMRSVSKWRDEYETQRSRGSEIKRNLEVLDQEITRAVGELQKAEQRRQQLDNSYGPLRLELKSKVDALHKTKDNLDAKRRASENIEANIKALTDQQAAHESELSSEFKKALTDQEEGQLANLNSTVQDLRRQYAELSTSRSELEGRKAMLEVELRENLRPRLDQAKAQEFENNGGGNGGNNLSQSQRDLKRISQALETISTKLHETDDAIEQASAHIAELEQHNADARKAQEEIAQSIERYQRRMDKSMAKKAALQTQAAACSRSIRDLGVLPEEAFSRFEKSSSNAIVKRLHKVNDALKKYTHVNKKAFEQYNNFTKQRDTLERRREELDSSQASIEELIGVLDTRKDEAIERTFKQVSKEFAAIFESLVPAGRGRLVIQRKMDRVQADEDEDDDERGERRASVENYTGVGISVSFNSKHDEQQRIQQLSGGQKSAFSPRPILFYPLLSHPAFFQPIIPKYHSLISHWFQGRWGGKREPTLTRPRSLRARARLRDPAMRPGALLPVRRDRRQPGRAVPHRGGDDAAEHRGQGHRQGRRRRPVHLHHLPAGDAPRRRQVLRRHLPPQDEPHRRRPAQGGLGVCRGPAALTSVCLACHFLRVVGLFCLGFRRRKGVGGGKCGWCRELG